MGAPTVYIPQDRRWAIARGEELPDWTQGAALFADISGFTPLTEVLVKELGSRRGADELTKNLNLVYNALITQVQLYKGSVIGFSGDAITCWFDNDEGLRAVACGLGMQQAMAAFEHITTPSGNTISLGMKAGIASGPARRFRVGDPHIQYIDVLAGQTLDRMAMAEQQAHRGEILVFPETAALLEQALVVAEWRSQPDETSRFAVVTGLVLSPPLPSDSLAPVMAEEQLTEEQVRPWLLPPIFERLRSGQDEFLAEIRPAVALFLKFGGLNYDQDNDAGKKLDRYIQWVQRTLARYEGYLIQLTVGDKGSYLYAAFGAPVAHDNEADRAVAAALELRSPPAEFDFIGPVQIGLSQGRMRTGAYGSPSRQTYGVLGDETNMAARLMNKAEPGQILITQQVAETTVKNYHLQALGPVRVKGRKEPLAVTLVLERRLPSPQRPATLFTQPLLAREAELTQLDKNLAAVLMGEGHVVRLEGLAGVGKSHLSAVFVERALGLGFRVGLGYCQSTSQNTAYHPWRQIFRALFRLTDEITDNQVETAAHIKAAIQALNPDWLLRLPLLSDLLGLPIPDNPTTAAFEPQLRQEALFSLSIEILQEWARERPLLLLIEDAHWLDEASWKLILTLSRVIAATPRVLLALVHRPVSPGEQAKPFFAGLDQIPQHDLLNLNELSSAGVAALVTYRLQGPITPLTASLIQLYAQGNPFYTEELVDVLLESRKLYRQSDGQWNLSQATFQALQQANVLIKAEEQWLVAPEANLSAIDLGIPDSIHGLVLSRLDRLPELHKLTLKVASVIGRVFEFEVLSLAHPLQPDQTALLAQIQGVEGRDFVRLEIPQPQLSYLFKHNITQEVVYQTLLDHQQRELHLAVGQAIEQLQPEAVERLAYHYRQSGVKAKALVYLEKAANKAQREYINETALNYYQQALSLEERWEWYKGQVEILHIQGRREEEQARLQKLATLPAVPPVHVAFLWGQYREAIGEYSLAETAVEQALLVYHQASDRLGEARCLTQLGLIASRQGDYQTAIVRYQNVLTLFRDQETHLTEAQRRVLAEALNGLGFVYREQGNFDQARNSHLQALKLSEQSDDRQREAEALNYLGVLARYQRQFATSHRYLQQALAIWQAIGDRTGEGTSLTNLADVTREMGDYSQAQAYCVTALAIIQATGHRWQEINVWILLGVLYQELGELTTAQTSLHQGLEVARQIGDEAGQNYLESNLGLVLRDLGDLAGAEALFNHRLKLYETEQNEYEMSFYLSYLSTVSLQAGQLHQAVAQAEQALALRQKLALHLNIVDDLALLAKAHLLAGDQARAVEYARQALAILTECNGEGPEFPARDYFYCYQVLTAAGESTAAQSALQAAYALVTTRAGMITDPALRQSFLECVAINREIVTACTRSNQ